MSKAEKAQAKKPEVKFEDLYDIDKIDDMVLALFFLTLDSDGRAWKGVDWSATDRLYEKGLIYDPKNKAKSVALTEEGIAKSKRLFEQYFRRNPKEQEHT
jgi:Domain of unknown function (DUF6429)